MLLLRRGLGSRGLGGEHGAPPGPQRHWQPGSRASELVGTRRVTHGRHSPATYHHHPGCREASVQGRAGLHHAALCLTSPHPPPIFSCSNPTVLQHSTQPPLPQASFVSAARFTLMPQLAVFLVYRKALCSTEANSQGLCVFIFLSSPPPNALHWISFPVAWRHLRQIL